jgi:nitroreductase
MALDAIRTFRAVREFSDQPVPDDIIRQIVNAGRRSQSSKNTQPWQFVVVRQPETLERLAECGTYAKHLIGCAFAVALVSPEETPFDQGQATAYMQLAAWESGVGSCIASMHQPEQAKAVLGVPSDHYLHTVLSFGYPACEQQPPLKRGGRRSFDEVVRWETWAGSTAE